MGHSATALPPTNYAGNLPYILVGLLILGYLFYQFGGLLFTATEEVDECCRGSRTKLRSRSRSRSRSKPWSHSPDASRSRDRHVRRRRETRCPSCGNKFDT